MQQVCSLTKPQSPIRLGQVRLTKAARVHTKSHIHIKQYFHSSLLKAFSVFREKTTSGTPLDAGEGITFKSRWMARKIGVLRWSGSPEINPVYLSVVPICRARALAEIFTSLSLSQSLFSRESLVQSYWTKFCVIFTWLKNEYWFFNQCLAATQDRKLWKHINYNNR